MKQTLIILMSLLSVARGLAQDTGPDKEEIQKVQESVYLEQAQNWNPYESFIFIRQSGTQNVAEVYQQGSGNQLNLEQHGEFNLYREISEGCDIHNTIEQNGSNLLIGEYIRGNEIDITVSQQGSGHELMLSGDGSGTSLSIEQSGKDMKISVEQNHVMNNIKGSEK